MEQELCLKDLFTYYLKRWHIIVICTVFGMMGFLVGFVSKDKHPPIEIRANAHFYSITSFLSDIKGMGISEENAALVSIYKQAASGVFRTMNSDYVKSEFMQSQEFFEQLTLLLDVMGLQKDMSKSKAIDFFVASTEFSINDDSFSVSMLGNFTSNESLQYAKSIVSLYLDMAVDYAYKLERVPLNSIIVTLPFVSTDFALQGKAYNYSLDYLKNVLIGALVGMALGAAIVFCMYLIDNRLKSFKTQMSELGGELLGTSKNMIITDDDVLRIIASLGHDRTLLVASARNDRFCFELSRKIVLRLKGLGFRTLYINLNKVNANKSSGQIASVKPKYNSRYGYYELFAKSKSDFSTFISQKEQLKNLLLGFDKVVITYCEEGQNALGVLKSYIDKALYVVNQAHTSFSKIKQMLDSLNEGNYALGTYIFNPL